MTWPDSIVNQPAVRSLWRQAGPGCWSGTHLPSVSVLSPLLSGHYDGKQSRVLICYALAIRFRLITFAFRSNEVMCLLLDLDTYGGTDPLGLFPLLLKRTADVLAPHLSVVFRRLVRLGDEFVFRRSMFSAIAHHELVSAHRPRLFFWTPLTNFAWCL